MKTRVDVLVRVRSLERDGKALALHRAEAELRQAEEEALAIERAISSARLARDEAQAAGGSVAPVAAVSPARDRADQKKDENDDQDSAEHGKAPFA